MTESVKLLFGFIGDIIGVLNDVTFKFYGVTVSFWSIIFVFIVIGMMVSVWWRGAKG